MKTIKWSSIYFGILTALYVLPLHAQETDDLYFSSKDLKKKKEQAAAVPNPERIYYTSPTGGNGTLENVSETQEQPAQQFNDPGYTNKYIEAEKRDGTQGNVSQNATTINNYYGNTGTSSSANSSSNNNSQYSEDQYWYQNNNYNLRRRAYGSRFSVSPYVSYNNWSGINFGIGGAWNSGWNNWYGWNSPYYNNWAYYNPFAFGMYNGFGYSGFGFGSYYYGNPYYNSFGYYNGFGNPYYGYGYGAYGSPYGYGYRNNYYGQGTAAGNGRKVNYGPINNGSTVTNTNGYTGSGRPGSGNPAQQRVESNGQPQAPNAYQPYSRPRESYNNAQPSQGVTVQPRQYDENSRFRGYDSNGGGNAPAAPASPAPQQRNDNYSRPQPEFRRYDNDGGGNSRPQSSGSPRMESGGGSFGGGGGSRGGGGGGGNSGGGGGGRPR